MTAVDDDPVLDEADLTQVLAALRRDYSLLKPRIRNLEHTVKCTCPGVTLRLHFPALRQGKATVHDLVNAIVLYLTTFALPRSQILQLDGLYGQISPDEFRLRHSKLERDAFSLFKRAQKATNRNGEAGEILLYLLTEWVLEAPQLLAKLGLKTNRDMAVHGADGIHVRYCPINKILQLYWGESKIYKDVNDAIEEATKSITKALKDENIEHELNLVERHIELSGLTGAAKQSVLEFLDPHDESSNSRVNLVTCLIGFDFDAFAKKEVAENQHADSVFRDLARAKLNELSPKISKSLLEAGIEGQSIELFFFPLPSVQQFRDLFQAKIGWK